MRTLGCYFLSLFFSQCVFGLGDPNFLPGNPPDNRMAPPIDAITDNQEEKQAQEEKENGEVCEAQDHVDEYKCSRKTKIKENNHE